METTTKVPINLFAAAKVKETAKKCQDKKILNAPDLGDKIQRYSELKQQIEASTGQLKMIEGDIKFSGKELFLKEYRQQRSVPDNFKIQDATGASILFIVQDKYTQVDQTKAEILGQFEDLVEEKTCFTMNPELVEKYQQVLSNLIINSPDISEDDKGRLITGEKSFCVKKGTIDRILQYEYPEQIFELVNPICSLKK